VDAKDDGACFKSTLNAIYKDVRIVKKKIWWG
jgi:hypothetical protein